MAGANHLIRQPSQRESLCGLVEPGLVAGGRVWVGDCLGGPNQVIGTGSFLRIHAPLLAKYVADAKEIVQDGPVIQLVERDVIVILDIAQVRTKLS